MIESLLEAREVSAGLSSESAKEIARALGGTGWVPYPESIVAAEGVIYYVGRREGEKRVCLVWRDGASPAPVATFCGEQGRAEVGGQAVRVQAGYLDHTNALGLRKHLAFCSPELVGVRAAVGCGDRLGIATPAHVRAVRGTKLRPVFAQQSIREMVRTGRTPDDVMDTATFGVFQEGYREGFGADADHLKTSEDVDRTVAAGFTMFTIDPGDHVDNSAETDDMVTVRQKFEDLPWPALETSTEDLCVRCLDKSVRLLDGSVVALDEESLFRGAVKYGRALAHTAAMYRHLKAKMGDREFELEMSVDETETPTSVAEHIFVARELQRLGVKWVSLAPRFVGRFEKGVDYIGDVDAFARTFAQHVAVAKHFGPYKISIHSGSDKFSIYPTAARLAGELVHLKTAGTSYLEALRAVARVAPDLFREILAFAVERYPEDRASYHVSADLGKVLSPERLKDEELAGALDQFDTREALHVTFGSVLTAESGGKPRFKERLMGALAEHEETHYEIVAAHMERHIRPFAAASRETEGELRPPTGHR
jgi:hypothetical protein